GHFLTARKKKWVGRHDSALRLKVCHVSVVRANHLDPGHRAVLAYRGCLGKSGRHQVLLLMRDDGLKDLIQAAAWPKSNQPPDLGNVWDAARHVLETGFVGFAVRNVHDLGG